MSLIRSLVLTSIRAHAYIYILIVLVQYFVGWNTESIGKSIGWKREEVAAAHKNSGYLLAGFALVLVFEKLLIVLLNITRPVHKAFWKEYPIRFHFIPLTLALIGQLATTVYAEQTAAALGGNWTKKEVFSFHSNNTKHTPLSFVQTT